MDDVSLSGGVVNDLLLSGCALLLGGLDVSSISEELMEFILAECLWKSVFVGGLRLSEAPFDSSISRCWHGKYSNLENSGLNDARSQSSRSLSSSFLSSVCHDLLFIAVRAIA